MSPLQLVKNGQEGGQGRGRPMTVGVVQIHDPEIRTTPHRGTLRFFFHTQEVVKVTASLLVNTC